LIEDLPAGHRLVIVTPFAGKDNDYSRTVAIIANYIRELPDSDDFITVADWAALIRYQLDLLGSDKTHLGSAGAIQLYADCVTTALSNAAHRPAKE
jgi:hypothetical protein